ncbi:MAG: class I SAM-dependent methyltransferase [Chlamydiales bacterium]|nr:class I SAM-dependent methyltransferase [Chlamydiales bacterium]
MTGYILGAGTTAELRLELLNELSSAPFVKAMKRLPNQNMRIIVLGCGSAHLEERLATLFSHSHFIGIDISKARLAEAKARVSKLITTNTYEFIEANLSTMPLEAIAPCDILISRFVLSHLQDAETVLSRFISRLRPGGYVCTEEGASMGTEFYCNTHNLGYETFVSRIDLQQSVQKSRFDIGLHLLSNPPGQVLHSHITQPILRTAREKSILRLGVEEGRQLLKNPEELIADLKKFEEDEKAFGLYMRFVAMIVQI